MRFFILCLAVVFSLSASRVAMAAADMHYDGNTGMIWIHNDSGGTLASASLISRDGLLTTPSAMLDLPGAIKDDSEFPYALTYLNFPPGNHSFGLVANPGLDFYTHGGFEFQYRTLTLLEPLTVGIWFFPEPASFALTGMGCFAVVAAGRKRLRKAVTSEP